MRKFSRHNTDIENISKEDKMCCMAYPIVNILGEHTKGNGGQSIIRGYHWGKTCHAVIMPSQGSCRDAVA